MSTSPATNDPKSIDANAPRAWHTLTAQTVATSLGVDPARGLSEQEAQERLRKFGPNRLRPQQQQSIWQVFLEEVREPLILLLFFTGIVYAIWGSLVDGLTIFAVIILLVGVEVVNEYRAKRAIDTLGKLSEPTARVKRDGQYVQIAVEGIVPGDVLLLEAGQAIPADARLIQAFGLAVNESALTGESMPVEKEADRIFAVDTPLAERRNLVFAGTTATRGKGTAVVVSTGMATELGRVAGLVGQAPVPRTLLQRTMRELTSWLVWLALGASVLVPLLGWLLAGQDPRQMVLTGLALAFSVIPEELPIIITLVLALGALTLARQNVIVRRLQAVETLGAVTVIATDKTGTLTENHIAVTQFYPDSQQRKLLELGVLANDAVDGGEQFKDNPLDAALLDKAQAEGLNVGMLRHQYPLRQEFTFDNERKRMSVVYERGGGLSVDVKGAPEQVLEYSINEENPQGEHPLSPADRAAILAQADHMAGEGLRVIAFAEKPQFTDENSQDAAESNLSFVGLVGMTDQVRPEAAGAIAACRRAGIRTMMITGDHPVTAEVIARQVGLDASQLITGPQLDALSDQALQDVVEKVAVYARTSPENKLRIVRALQARSETVAVTGDGINDAPALAAADVGVAMGETGTDVARQAAGIVLMDDNFATIVGAVRVGRNLFANLTKGIRYYLACKLALVGTTLLPVFLRVPIPFAPIQIILMELFMDLAASATFAVEPPESDLMERPPRDPKAKFMDRAMVSSIFTSAFGLFAAVSFVYLYTWFSQGDLIKAQTTAFVTWLLGHVLLALNLRSEREPLVSLGLFSNRLMIVWAAATVIFVLLVTFVPAVQVALKTTSLQASDWLLVVGAAFVGTFWIEVRKLYLQRTRLEAAQ